MGNIREIFTQFEEKTLPKKEWTHHAHIAVAFAELDKSKDFKQALNQLRKKISEYNTSVGTDNTDNSGYHETITAFWLTVIESFYATNNELSLSEVYDAFTQKPCAKPDFPLSFYSEELLFSTAARLRWTKPDLLPLSEIEKFILKDS